MVETKESAQSNYDRHHQDHHRNDHHHHHRHHRHHHYHRHHNYDNVPSHLKWLRPKKVPGAISEMLFASSLISSRESWRREYHHDDDDDDNDDDDKDRDFNGDVVCLNLDLFQWILAWRISSWGWKWSRWWSGWWWWSRWLRGRSELSRLSGWGWGAIMLFEPRECELYNFLSCSFSI